MPRSKRNVAGRPARDPLEPWMPEPIGSLLLGLEGVQEQFHDLAVRIAMATPPEPPEKRKAIFDARVACRLTANRRAPMR